MKLGLFNMRGIDESSDQFTEYFIKLELDELISRGHDVTMYCARGRHPTREEAKEMDFAIYHFVPTALHFRRMGVPYCVLPTANDVFIDEGEKLKILDNDKKCKFIGHQSHYHFLKYRQWKIQKPKVFVPHCARVDLFKRETKYNPNGKILAGGRLIPKKGLDRLKDVENLTIFGNGPLREKLERILPDSTTFTGYLDGKELKQLYEEASIYLFSGIVTPDGDSDGISNTIKEAQLMQLPVISSPVAGNVEFKTIRFLTNWNRINELLKQPRVANKKGDLAMRQIYSPKSCVDKLLAGIEEYI